MSGGKRKRAAKRSYVQQVPHPTVYPSLSHPPRRAVHTPCHVTNWHPKHTPTRGKKTHARNIVTCRLRPTSSSRPFRRKQSFELQQSSSVTLDLWYMFIQRQVGKEAARERPIHGQKKSACTCTKDQHTGGGGLKRSEPNFCAHTRDTGNGA